MIQLGLSRILRLFDPSTIKWKAIHVAGTNGKGSVCAYAAAVLASAGWKVGRYTSPHLIDRWDCIEIGGRAIERDKFEAIHQMLDERNKKNNIDASEFELLTATAFEAFNQESVDVGVVEVGMGGREDATNILLPESILTTVITKIGMDHESMLGKSLSEVAWHKAGIMKSGVPCLYDSTNAPDVIEVLRQEKQKLEATAQSPVMLTPVTAERALQTLKSQAASKNSLSDGYYVPDHLLIAMSLALAAASTAAKELASADTIDRTLPSEENLAEILRSYEWAGRLQRISIQLVTKRQATVLLDGAHNLDSAKVLAEFVDSRLRELQKPVTWVYASSMGKNIEGMAKQLFKHGDAVFTTEFGAVDGMPWVRPQSAEVSLRFIKEQCELDPSSEALPDVLSAIQKASERSKDGPMVIAGSLYLVSDTLRLLRREP